MRTEVVLANPAAIAKLIKALNQKAKTDLRLIMRSFGEHMYNSVQLNFDQEGRPVKWLPLKPATIRAWLRRRKTWIAKRRPFAVGLVGPYRIPLTRAGAAAWAGVSGQSGRKILTDTGALRSSVHYAIIGNTKLALRAGGQAAPYAPKHQYGDPSRNLPARPYLMVQPEDWEVFRDMLQRYLTEGLGG